MESGESNNKTACYDFLKNIDDVKIKDITNPIDNELNCTQVDTENTNCISRNNEDDSTSSKYSTEWINSSASIENIIPTPTEGHQKLTKPKDTFLKNKTGVSDSELINKKSSTSGFAKILQWDPWHKIRRNKKKDKHKKSAPPQTVAPDFVDKSEGANLNAFDMKSMEETIYEIVPLRPNTEYDDIYEAPAKERKVQKNVRFQTDVTVVLFGNDQIIAETVEPLKKEQEQQERNKELRKEICPESFKPNNWKKNTDYMSSWYIRRK